MEKKGWKILGIISLSINVLGIILLVTIMTIGANEIERENKCAGEICFNSFGDKVAYTYDGYSGMCQCLIDGEVVYNKIVQ